jgi:hypothetical protein
MVAQSRNEIVNSFMLGKQYGWYLHKPLIISTDYRSWKCLPRPWMDIGLDLFVDAASIINMTLLYKVFRLNLIILYKKQINQISLQYL